MATGAFGMHTKVALMLSLLFLYRQFMMRRSQMIGGVNPA